MKAVWKGVEVARSDNTVVVEGNHYFPPGSIQGKYFQESATRSQCPWKGEASYYSLAVEGELNEDAAWYYPEPKEAALRIKNHVAFWKGVEILP